MKLAIQNNDKRSPKDLALVFFFCTLLLQVKNIKNEEHKSYYSYFRIDHASRDMSRITHYASPQKMKTHKDLDVWKEAMTMVKGIYKLTAEFPKEEIYGWLSVSNKTGSSINSK